ncbi:hypothetical protein T552_00628 [Pneumocystis carinii B80]|uniref:Aminopeptidase n=1 Tax=Pneumocystis carinii (strain B80) TaxID=1408658 RepID=A0A0W4ZP69_PNEC8|nr:hypothetical protein T552_00628 [Pneumocystis carinii B80]KTW30150.1 hypothetical protein T552_00628 [Pneumocystis carinii B80]
MCGFYRSSYQDNKTREIKWLACTQMEATDCRRAFPCWDEPALKATFDIEITADVRYTILSNMDILRESIIDDKRTVLFSRTPLMSTYLLAWVIGELDYIEMFTSGINMPKIPVRVYSPLSNLSQDGRFSLELAVKTLDFFSKTFGIPYSLPKLDMVAIPDFSAGAMENWGIVTYRVVDLLFNEKTGSAATKQRVAEVVQHELAHQWFGDLVTMDFWDGLWLNEGFATWMSWFSCNTFYPEWKVWQTYITGSLQNALRFDGFRSSHPIQVLVKSAEEINQIFDAISYSKGSSVIRMLSKYLGEDVFLAGIRQYLKDHSYGNATTDDLWKALSDESGKDILKFMKCWTENVGYPVLTVSENDDTLIVRQNRFLASGDVRPEDDTTIYWVPLMFKTMSLDGKITTDSYLILDKREFQIPISNIKKGFYKINTGHSGIYRTLYCSKQLQRLGSISTSNPEFLTVEDRVGLVADTGSLAESGYCRTSDLLALILGWHNEDSFVVWNETIVRLENLEAAFIFESEQIKHALGLFKKALVSNKARKLGWNFDANSTHIERQFKTLMFGTAGKAGDDEIISTAKDMLYRYMDGDTTAIHSDLRAHVFGISIQYGSEKEWNIVYSIYKNGTSSDERNTALKQLGLTRVPHLISRTLNLIISSEVKLQDIYMPLIGLKTHSEGIKALWKFCNENWDTIDNLVPSTVGSLKSTVVQLMVSGFTSISSVHEIESFFKDKKIQAFDKALSQSLDAIRAKASWVSRDYDNVKAWLENNGYLNTT